MARWSDDEEAEPAARANAAKAAWLILNVSQKMKSALQHLSDWYAAQCDGHWEHGFGFTITTLDNPGVAVDISLTDTPLASVPFEEKKDNYDSESEWMICSRKEDRFEGRGAPGRLEDIILEFLAWAESHPKKANQSPEPMPLKRHGSS